MNQTIELQTLELETTAGYSGAHAELRGLVGAAVRAPSGDNRQPWRFEIRPEENSIDVFLDASRDRSPMNAGQRMSLLACGAAVENILAVARERGWHAALELPQETSGVADLHRVARIRLEVRWGEPDSDHITQTIAERVTNRRLYDGRPVNPLILADLEQSTATSDQIRTHWLTERPTLNALAEIIARGDAALFSEPTMRNTFLANVRFDLPPAAEVEEGLSLASLEASRGERVAMQTMRVIPNALFQLTGGGGIFASHARKLVQSSSGLCVIAVEQDAPHAEFHAGRAMQRAWLALTEMGISAQPMMSLMVLNSALQHGTPELISGLQRRGVASILNEFQTTLQSAGVNGRAAFVLRFGYAAAPSGRTGRLQH